MSENQYYNRTESEMCKKSLDVIKNQNDIYEKSLKIQIILFLLFLLLLSWLLYHLTHIHK